MDTRCPTCQAHLRRRRTALLPLFGRTMQATGEPAHEIRARFLGGLHKRHLDGGSLLVLNLRAAVASARPGPRPVAPALRIVGSEAS